MKFQTSSHRVFPSRILLNALWIVLGTTFLGCAGNSALLSRPPGSVFFSPDDALLALAASAPDDQTLTVIARIEFESHGERRPLKAALMMKKPASLRMESVPLLGPPDFFLSVDAGELRVFSPGDNGGRFYMGRSTVRNLNRFFPLTLPAADIIPLLMGQPPGIEAISSCLGGWEERLYHIDRCMAAERMMSLWIDPVGGHLLRVRAYAEGGAIAYTADFSDHIPVGKYILPRRLTITGGAVSLTLRYTEVRLDNDAEPFALPIPDGVAPISLDE
ncbi:MAG: DUF4292 domain-containing protein [Deltaproteobacteria bacterium]|nr:DUF4292 domain-containing protein [Deltaproteobacteria bacterium]